MPVWVDREALRVAISADPCGDGELFNMQVLQGADHRDLLRWEHSISLQHCFGDNMSEAHTALALATSVAIASLSGRTYRAQCGEATILIGWQVDGLVEVVSGSSWQLTEGQG